MSNKITLYTQPNCHPCMMVKRVLTNREISYNEINVREDNDALAHIAELGYMQTPVLEIENVGHMGGFNPGKLQSLLNSDPS